MLKNHKEAMWLQKIYVISALLSIDCKLYEGKEHAALCVPMVSMVPIHL